MGLSTWPQNWPLIVSLCEVTSFWQNLFYVYQISATASSYSCEAGGMLWMLWTETANAEKWRKNCLSCLSSLKLFASLITALALSSISTVSSLWKMVKCATSDKVSPNYIFVRVFENNNLRLIWSSFGLLDFFSWDAIRSLRCMYFLQHTEVNMAFTIHDHGVWRSIVVMSSEILAQLW